MELLCSILLAVETLNILRNCNMEINLSERFKTIIDSYSRLETLQAHVSGLIGGEP